MGGAGAGAGRGSSILRGFLRAILLLSFLCFVSAEILVKQKAKTVNKTIAATTSNHLEARRITTETERHFLLFKRNTNLNYVSKRRVWSEPDPLHNREAGKYMETRIRA